MSNDITVAFTGCSFVYGTGFAEESKSLDLWVNNIDLFKNKKYVNYGIPSGSNAEIFAQSLEAITKHPNLEYLLVSWTFDPRHQANVGFELYDTRISLSGNNRDHHINEGTISGKSIDKAVKEYRKLLHPHLYLVNIVKYTNIIKNFAHRDTKVIFINALGAWDDQFWVRKTGNFLPSDLTPYTQNWILNIHNRSDEEIFKLYDLQHTLYEEAGGIDPKDWVNLYNSFARLQKDYNSDQNHPGVESNKIYAKIVNEYLERNK